MLVDIGQVLTRQNRLRLDAVAESGAPRGLNPKPFQF
jgi:hypothetical protein